ncbi:inhibitor of vertebrate lysozyme family protein [Ancylobacter sp. 6x-1]|uniref:Inhibitor of vertebrate lysozyme family protein n=1 Tax=Ancylobacter crimeensis TaxID=2579147 RepID=A0ABT0DEJ3_9HYPH|nr:Ivy family c-type lysozyme inhibitor [Ancylobacter crimeensis]MCK0198371.1 inhibitor of vertebrate lysozyme family protein [Ancylobacter crimeensis]
MSPRVACLALFVVLAAQPAAAQVRNGADALQLVAASGMTLKNGTVVNPCGRPTNPRVRFIDLDGDGGQEAVSEDRDPACYGPKPGIQSKVLARDRSGRWRVVGVVPGVVKPVAGRSNGWANVTVEGRGCQPVWRFDGQHYRPTACPAAGAAQAAAPKPAAPKPAAPNPVAPNPAAPPAGAAVASAAASAAGGSDPDLSRFPETYGRFAPGGGGCTRLPRVTIAADAIRIETPEGTAAFPRAGVPTNFMGPEDTSITYFLQGAGEGLVVTVDRNDLRTAGGERLGAAEKALSAAADVNGPPLRRCGAQMPAPAPAPAPQMRASASGDVDALLKDGYTEDPGFMAAYRKALGPLAAEDWLTSFEGPGDSRAVTLAGTRYLLAAVCKPHDCGDNAMMVLYRPDTGALFGIVSIRHGKRTVGNSPAPLRPDLLRLWKDIWPAG